MQTPKLHRRATGPLAPDTPRRYRRVVLLSAGTLALVLATAGIVAAVAGPSAPVTQGHEPSGTRIDPTTIAAPQSSRTGLAAPNSTAPTTANLVLTDGTYPTYIREVDVDGARITVDVIQVFQDEAAAKAAIEDGKSPSDARYLSVYIRNQNSLLRTLPVARDVGIHFLGTCEAPPDRHEGLTELAKKTTPFDTTYYYDVTVRDGAINDITQRLAIPAC